MKCIAEWLESIGLAEYTQRFAENAIDLSTIRDLTDQDLKELGVLLGHRRKILRAIAELGVTTTIPASTSPASKPERESSDDAERRHLTVMFCNLVGSNALATRLDAEDRLQAVASYRKAIDAVIGRYQGMIAQYMGDGVLAYFGYPVAQEDSAVQAVRAALEIIDAVASLRIDVSTALQARIGIATGTVVRPYVIGTRQLSDQQPVRRAPLVRHYPHARPDSRNRRAHRRPYIAKSCLGSVL